MQVEEALRDERQRAELYLQPTVTCRLMDACQQVLVDQRLPFFRHQFDLALRAQDDDGNGRVPRHRHLRRHPREDRRAVSVALEVDRRQEDGTEQCYLPLGRDDIPAFTPVN